MRFLLLLCALACTLLALAADVTALRQQLRSTDPTVRMEAAKGLATDGDAQDVPALVKAIDDEFVFVGGAAVDALGQIADPAATDALIGVLRDAQSPFHQQALTALRRIADPRACEAIIPYLRGQALPTQVAAARALEFCGDKTAVKPLITAVDDPDPGFCKAALTALAAIDLKAAIEPAATCLTDKDHALARDAMLILARAKDPRALPLLIASICPDERYPEMQSIDYYVEYGTMDTRVALLGYGAPACTALEKAIADEPHPNHRIVFMNVLWRTMHTRSLAPFLTLMHDENSYVSSYAALILSLVGNEEGINAILLLRESKDPWIVRLLEQSFTQIADPRVFAAYTAGFETMPLVKRKQVLESLSTFMQNPKVSVADFLIAATKDVDEAVRKRASQLFDVSDVSVSEKFIPIGLRDPSPEIRKIATNGIAKTLLPQYADLCLPLLKHADASIRQSAIQSLASLCDPRVIEPLCGLVEHDPSEVVREEALHALGVIGDTRAADAIYTLFEQKQCDPFDALMGLAELKDPRSFEPCLQMLLKGDERSIGRAAVLLSILHDPRTVGAVRPLLNDKRPLMRVTAAEILLRFGEEVDMVQLVEHVKSEDSIIANKAWFALGNTPSTAVIEPLLPLLKSKEQWQQRQSLEVWTSIACAHPDAEEFDAIIPTLREYVLTTITKRSVDNNPEGALRLLATMQRPSCGQVIYDCYNACKDGFDIKNLALDILGQSDAPPRARALIRELAANGDLHARIALARQGDAASFDGLGAMLMLQSGYEQVKAIRLVASIDDPRAVDAIGMLLESPQSHVMTIHALLDAPKCNPQIIARAAATLKNTDVSGWDFTQKPRFINWLAEKRRPEAVPGLLDFLPIASIPLKISTINALAKINDPRAIEPITAQLTSESYAVRFAVQKALAEMKAGK